MMGDVGALDHVVHILDAGFGGVEARKVVEYDRIVR